MKWYKGWRMKAGSVLTGAAVFLTQLPAIQVGSLNGEPISAQQVVLGLGVALFGYGWAGKFDKDGK